MLARKISLTLERLNGETFNFAFETVHRRVSFSFLFLSVRSLAPLDQLGASLFKTGKDMPASFPLTELQIV